MNMTTLPLWLPCKRMDWCDLGSLIIKKIRFAEMIRNTNKKPSLLIVDDAPENLQLIGGLLNELYSVKVAASGDRALKILSGDDLPDLILLDVMMPGLSGWEVCGVIKADSRLKDIPVIFLTAKADMADEQAGLELGAVDYITKPISPPILMARVSTHLKLKQANDFLRDSNDYLAAEVDRRTAEISALQDVTVIAMASLAETRDNETGNHIRRTQLYIKALAEKLKNHPRFSAYLTDDQIRTLVRSAPLHDIGKVGIPDRILLKPGRLDADEFEIMKTHTTIGRDAIADAERAMPFKSTFLQCAREIALSHQEKWDGSGYPEGLSGEAIPISARLMAVADVYDALISKRYYKDAMPHEQAMAIIAEGSGSHFDPDIAAALAVIGDEINAIAQSLSDD